MTLKNIFVRRWNVRLGDRCNYFHRRCAVFSRYWPWWCVRWLRWHFSVTRDHCIYRYSMDHMPVPVSLLLNPCNYILHRCETSSCLCIMIVAHTWTQNTDIEQYVNNTVENVSTNLRWFIILYHLNALMGGTCKNFETLLRVAIQVLKLPFRVS